MLTASAQDIELLVHLLGREHEAVERSLRARRAPPASFLRVVEVHGLSVMVLRALDDSPARGAFAAEDLERLERARRRQAERSERLLEVLAHLAARFGAAQLPFLLLKGPYLAARYYGDLSAREFVDLDLLVPSADRARAFRLLEAEGFARKSNVLLDERLTCFFVHGFDFADARARVDLHWHLCRHPAITVDEAALWRRRQSYALAGGTYDVLADEDEVIFAVVSLLRDLERGRPKLKNVVDLLQIVRTLDPGFEWNSLLDGRREEGVRGPLVNVLGLCLDVAGAHTLTPRLSATLARHAARRLRATPSEAPLSFRPTAYNLGTRLWCARAYDRPLALWLSWWAMSLPFRLAVHRPPRPQPPRPPRA